MLDIIMQLLFIGVLFVLLLLLIKALCCFPCRSRYSVSLVLISNGVINVDNTIPLPGSSVAAAVIMQNGTPIGGAVFDADPNWVINDPSIISFSQTSIQTGLVTALAAGVTTLDVDGAYLGNAVHGTAIVTVTSTPQGFSVDIQWTNNPSLGAARK